MRPERRYLLGSAALSFTVLGVPASTWAFLLSCASFEGETGCTESRCNWERSRARGGGSHWQEESIDDTCPGGRTPKTSGSTLWSRKASRDDVRRAGPSLSAPPVQAGARGAGGPWRASLLRVPSDPEEARGVR